MTTVHVARMVAAAGTIAALAACKNSSQPMDQGLKQDLAAAVATQQSHLVISPEELSPSATPARAAPKRTPRPAPFATPNVPQPEPAAAPQPKQQAEAPAPQPPQEPAQQAPPQTDPAPAASPRPVPAQTEGARHGPYKTEAEIFRQMPWIRP